MSQRDYFALLVSFVYPVALLFAAEAIRRRFGWQPEFTRKLVHVGAGMWVFGALLLFEHTWVALIATTAFIVINYVSARRTLIPAMDAARSEGWGTVLFMVSFTILLAWLPPQGRPQLAAAGMMAMTWGDAAAALLGRRFGRHRYSIDGHTRSLEGSLACVLFTWVSVTITLLLLAGNRYSLLDALISGLLAGIFAALLEAAAPAGIDNLTVSLGTALLLLVLETGAASYGAVALGLLLAGLIAVAAYRAGSLDEGGAIGAALTGATIFALGGLVWGVLLIAFFITSTILTRYGARRPQKQQATLLFAKGGRRDLRQVLANGGLAALISVPYALAGADWRPLLFGAFVGVLGAVTADTWSTEIGVLSKRPPRLVTTGKTVAPGTSGAMSGLGTLAAAAGGLLIGALGWILQWLVSGVNQPVLLLAGLAGGLGGGFVDSLLGATVQTVYWCPNCKRETETPVHSCGTPTQLRRGLPWVDNDLVNLICSLAGAVIGLLVARVWPL